MIEVINTNPHSSDELNKMIEHVAYEIHMFRWAYLMLALQLIKLLLHGNLNNAILESWVIHLRNLIDFFYAMPQKDDIVASDYISDWDSIRSQTQKSPLLQEATNKANKQLAHLTLARATQYNDAQKPWEYIKISTEIEKWIALFFEHLSSEQKAGFKNYGL